MKSIEYCKKYDGNAELFSGILATPKLYKIVLDIDIFFAIKVFNIRTSRDTSLLQDDVSANVFRIVIALRINPLKLISTM